MPLRLLLLLACATGAVQALRPCGVCTETRPALHRRASLVAASATPSPSGGGLSGLIGTQWSRYMRALDEDPMVAKMATAAVLATAGDLIAQRLERVAVLSVGRVLALVAVNIAFITPVLSWTYALNEHLCGSRLKLRSGSAAGTLARLAFDQLVNAPLVIWGFFWAFGLANGVIAAPLSGRGVTPFAEMAAGTSALIKQEYVGTIIKNWLVWVPPQMINFGLMPPKLRVPFASLVALVWNVVQSLIANQPITTG